MKNGRRMFVTCLVAMGFLFPTLMLAESQTPVSEKADNPVTLFAGQRQTQTVFSSVTEPGNLRKLRELGPGPVGAAPAYFAHALADFQLSLRKDFVEFSGSAEGKMTRIQFERFLATGRLPSRKSGEDYFAFHDQDKDGMLTIAEFTPTGTEVLQSYSANDIAQGYLHGTPYPNRSLPLGTPFLSPGDADPGKKVVPFPRGLIPLPKEVAEKELKEYVQKTGGSMTSSPEGLPVVKDASGAIVPVHRWPPHLRPPYLPRKS